MTTITIEVPDTLASQLLPYQERLSEILAPGLGGLSPMPGKVYQHVLTFLAGGPTTEELAHFRPRLFQFLILGLSSDIKYTSRHKESTLSIE